MRRRVLSISDNSSMNYVLKTALQSEITLVTVKNTLEAIDELKVKKDINLVILDLDYHLQENLEFIEILTNSYLYFKPFIFLTSDTAIRDSLPKNCSFKLIKKPFNPELIIKDINSLLSEANINNH
jgi:CheY-like chemotaxis protein